MPEGMSSSNSDDNSNPKKNNVEALLEQLILKFDSLGMKFYLIL
jgi:hypothetical protein